jgi:hypothetical protein
MKAQGRLPNTLLLHVMVLQLLVRRHAAATSLAAGWRSCCGGCLAAVQGYYLRPFLPFLPDLPLEAPAAARASRSSFSLAACAAAWAFLDRPGCFGTSSATRLYRVFPA